MHACRGTGYLVSEETPLALTTRSFTAAPVLYRRRNCANLLSLQFKGFLTKLQAAPHRSTVTMVACPQINRFAAWVHLPTFLSLPYQPRHNRLEPVPRMMVRTMSLKLWLLRNYQRIIWLRIMLPWSK